MVCFLNLGSESEDMFPDYPISASEVPFVKLLETSGSFKLENQTDITGKAREMLSIYKLVTCLKNIRPWELQKTPHLQGPATSLS